MSRRSDATDLDSRIGTWKEWALAFVLAAAVSSAVVGAVWYFQIKESPKPQGLQLIPEEPQKKNSANYLNEPVSEDYQK